MACGPTASQPPGPPGQPGGRVAQRGRPAAGRVQGGQAPAGAAVGGGEELLADDAVAALRAHGDDRVPRGDNAVYGLGDTAVLLPRVGAEGRGDGRVRLLVGGQLTGILGMAGQGEYHGGGDDRERRSPDHRRPAANFGPPGAPGTGRGGLEQRGFRHGRPLHGSGLGDGPGLGQHGLGAQLGAAVGPRLVGQPGQQLIGARPALRILGQRGQDQRPEQFRDRRGIRLGMQDPVQDGIGGSGAERHLPAGGVGEGHGPGEDVGRRPGAPGDLLRRHEAGRADHHAGPGHRRRVQGLGDAEIDDLGAVVAQDDVGGLEVAVHDPGCVNDGQRLGQAGGQAVHHVGPGRPVRGDVFGQRRSWHVVGGHEREGRVGLSLDHPHRAHALHPGQVGHLAAEPVPELRVIGQIGAEHLDRDEVAVAGRAEIDHAHPAGAEPGGQPVAPDLGRVRVPKRRASQGSSPSRVTIAIWNAVRNSPRGIGPYISVYAGPRLAGRG